MYITTYILYILLGVCALIQMIMTKNDIIKKRYPFFDENVYGKGIELDSDAVKELMNDLIDEIIKMYVPDGNPDIWLNKIEKLRDDVF